jgi:hypothetical protein
VWFWRETNSEGRILLNHPCNSLFGCHWAHWLLWITVANWVPGNSKSYRKQSLWNPDLRQSAHQGNWQPQHNRDFREKSPTSSRQLVSRFARAHWGNLICCWHHLKWVCLPANFEHFFSAMSDNNIDPAIIWWWLGRRKKRRQEKRKHWVHPFFRDNLN